MPRTQSHLAFRPWSASGAASPPHRSFWVAQALERDAPGDASRLQGTARCDVAIVGGGLSGLWTAVRLKLAEPALSVAILEADVCGAGASGRNSGAVGHYWSRLPALVRYFGEPDARRVLAESVRAIDDTVSFMAANRIDAELRVGPSAWTNNVPGQAGPWEVVLKTAERLGLTPPYRRLSDPELRQAFGSGPYYSGVIDDHAVRLQPAMLVRGLRRVALFLGVVLHEKSPVREVVGGPGGLELRTGEGALSCAKLVLAANAWMAHLPEFRSQVMVLSSDIVMTKPIPARLDRLGMQGRPGGVNSRHMLNYGGITPDGRVYLGRGGGTIAYGARIDGRFDYSPSQSAQVEADFRFLYPELRDEPIALRWAGPIDRCTTGLPTFGQVKGDPRIHYVIGYTGHGLGASNIAGKVLAARILDRRDEWADLGDIMNRADNGFYPPEPLRFVAGTIVRRAVLRKELAEREKRRVSRIDASLARLALAAIPTRRRAR